MGIRKSDPETAHNTARAQELNKAGLNQTETARVLGVHQSTVSRNLAKAAKFMKDKDAIEIHQAEQYIWLQELKMQLSLPGIKNDRRIELALSILDREMKLLGTAEPSKSITAHVNADGNGRFHRFVTAAAGLSDAQLEQVFQFALNIPREQLAMPAGPPPLQLEEGNNEE